MKSAARLFHPSEVTARWPRQDSALVEGLLPTGLTLFIGRPGEGKSTLLRQLVLSVVEGRPFLGHDTLQSNVAYLSLEEPASRLLESLTKTAHGGKVPEALLLLGSDSSFSLDDLPQMMAAHTDVRLWVLDPLPAAWDLTESSGYREEYQIGHRIKRLADAHSAAFVVTAHAGKRRDSNAVTASTGTVGLPGAADNRWLIVRRPRGKATFYMGGGRRLTAETIPLDFDGNCFQASARSVETPFPPAAVTRGISPERQAIIDALRAVGYPLRPKEVAERVGRGDVKGRASVKTLLRKMMSDGQVVSTGDGRYELT